MLFNVYLHPIIEKNAGDINFKRAPLKILHFLSESFVFVQELVSLTQRCFQHCCFSVYTDTTSWQILTHYPSQIPPLQSSQSNTMSR